MGLVDEGLHTNAEVNKENAQSRKIRRRRTDHDRESTPRKSKRLMVGNIYEDKHIGYLPNKEETMRKSTPRNETRSKSSKKKSYRSNGSKSTLKSFYSGISKSIDTIQTSQTTISESIQSWSVSKKSPTKALRTPRFSLMIHEESNLTQDDLQKLCDLNLSTIYFSVNNHRILRIGRQTFASLGSNYNKRRVGRIHCMFKICGNDLKVQRCSANGTLLINDVNVEMGHEKELRRGDVVTLYSTPRMSIKYTVSMQIMRVRLSTKRLSEGEKLNSIVVCAAAPLIGLDRSGNMHSIPDIHVEHEYKLIQSALTHKPNIPVKHRVATWPELRSLALWGCHVLHFMGQGSEHHIYFEDNLGMVHPVSYSAMLNMLDTDKTKPRARLVVLSYNPSQSLVNVFVAHGVPHVVVVNDSTCLSAFYDALTSGKSVQAAVDVACSTHPGQSPKMSALSLHPEGAKHDEILFRWASTSNQQNISTPFCRQILPPIAEKFSNRNAEVFRVCEYLATKSRLISITGDAGVGKTNVAIAVTHRVSHRHHLLGSGSRIRFCSVPLLATQSSSLIPNSCIWKLYIRRRTSTYSTDLKKWPHLIVLDGCDAWANDPSTLVALHDLLETWFSTNSKLQVILTIRRPITFAEPLSHVQEEELVLSNYLTTSSQDPCCQQKPEELNSRFQTLSIECT